MPRCMFRISLERFRRARSPGSRGAGERNTQKCQLWRCLVGVWGGEAKQIKSSSGKLFIPPLNFGFGSPIYSLPTNVRATPAFKKHNCGLPLCRKASHMAAHAQGRTLYIVVNLWNSWLQDGLDALNKGSGRWRACEACDGQLQDRGAEPKTAPLLQ